VVADYQTIRHVAERPTDGILAAEFTKEGVIACDGVCHDKTV